MAGASAQAEPFPVRDQNPLVRGVYLPLSRQPMTAESSWQQDLTLTVSNTTNIEARDGEELLVDGEATELRWNGRWQFARRWEVQFSVPIVHYGGGWLDSAIEDWHRFLGLPRGDRPLRPENQLEYSYQDGNGHSLEVSDSHTGLADSSIEAGFSALSTAAATIDLWIGVELPTGDPDALTGNGAVDVAGWISGQWRLTQSWALDAKLGLARPGSVDPLPLEPNNVIPFGTVALSWARPRYGFAVQLDAHDSCVKDSRLDFLGPATLLTVGGHYQTVGGWRFELAVTEDVRVGASPDVAFYFGIRRQH
jgi:hypothetical protein